MQDKDFDMRLKRVECPVKVAGIISVTIQWKRWQVERDKDFREGTDG